MISSRCVNYQDAHTEAVGSGDHENPSADARASDLQRTDKEHRPFQVTPEGTVKRRVTLNTAKVCVTHN